MAQLGYHSLGKEFLISIFSLISLKPDIEFIKQHLMDRNSQRSSRRIERSQSSRHLSRQSSRSQQLELLQLNELRNKTKTFLTSEPRDHAQLVLLEYTILLEDATKLYRKFNALRESRQTEAIKIGKAQQSSLNFHSQMLSARNIDVERWFQLTKEENFKEPTKHEAAKYMCRLKELTEKFKANQREYESLNAFHFVQKLRRENQELRLRIKEPKRISRTQYIEKEMEAVKQQFEARLAQAQKKKTEAQEETSKYKQKQIILLQRVMNIDRNTTSSEQMELITAGLKAIATILDSSQAKEKRASQEYKHISDMYFEKFLKTFQTNISRSSQSSALRPNVPKPEQKNSQKKPNILNIEYSH